MKFLFTCGGTAGHINPALGVASRIRELLPDSEFLFVGAKGKMETELIPREGYDIVTVEITNLRRGFKPDQIVHNLKTVRNVIVSMGQAKKIIQEFHPDVAVGTGGYVCYPVLRAAHKLGVPTAIHESNAVPGLTTKLLSKLVDQIMVGFEEAKANYSCPEKVLVTGTPVRSDFRNLDKATARAELGIPAEKPLVVSVWGSLGATYMNRTIAEMIALAAKDPDFLLIHSAGKRGYESMRKDLAARGVENCDALGFEVREYIYDMSRVMAAADVVMCRSGASTLSELTAMGKPALLIPSPNVTGNHQEKNARVLEAAGGAKVLVEGAFTAESLLATLRALLADPAELTAMSENMKKTGVASATDKIAEIVLGLAQKHADTN